MIGDQRDTSYEAFRKHALTWSPYFHYGLFEGTEDLETAQERTLDKLAELCRIEQASRVLDVGCGIGSTSIYMARNFGCTVVGIDPVESQVSYGQQLAQLAGVTDRVSLRVGDAERIPESSDSFDVVLVNEVFCLIERKAAAFREIRRVLRAGGRMGLSDLYDRVGGDATEVFHRAMHHVVPMLTMQEMLAHLEDAGFAIREVLDRQGDVAESYRAALSRLSKKRADVVSQLGEGEYELCRSFYQFCLTPQLSNALGWALYCAE